MAEHYFVQKTPHLTGCGDRATTSSLAAAGTIINGRARRLREPRQIIWDLSEIAAGIILLHVDRFEEKGLSFHLNLQKGHLPVSPRDLCLLNVERTAFIQVPEQAPAKFHLMDQVTGDFFYPRLLTVYPDTSFDGMKDFGFARGWVKAWIRCEVQLYEVISAHPDSSR